MRDPMNQELDDLRAELAAVKSQRDEALSNEGYKDNVLGDMSGYVQAQYAIKDSLIRALERAMRKCIDDCADMSGALPIQTHALRWMTWLENALKATEAETKGDSHG